MKHGQQTIVYVLCNLLFDTVMKRRPTKCTFLKNVLIYYKNEEKPFISPGLTFTDSPFCPRNVFICFVWLPIQTAFVSVHSIHRLVFIKQTVCLLRGTNWTFKCNVSYCNICTVHFYIVFINNQQIQLLKVLLFHSTAPTCFDTRTSSPGSLSLPATTSTINRRFSHLCFKVLSTNGYHNIYMFYSKNYNFAGCFVWA
jgi:hypothetical protein